MSLKKMLKGIVWAGSIIIFFIMGPMIFLEVTENNLMANKPLINITIGQFILLLAWLVSAYILTNFLKNTSVFEDEENKPKK